MMIEEVLARFAVREQVKMPLDLPDARILVAELRRLQARVAELEQELRWKGEEVARLQGEER